MRDFGARQQKEGGSGEWERSIQVVTTVEQDVENIGGSGKEDEAGSETGSQRGLFG